IKITGLTREIVESAMHQAHQGRLHILGEMEKTIKSHREEFKDNVPRVKTRKIDTDKIGMLIGPGGKHIKGLQENFKVTIEIAEDGTVKVLGEDAAAINECLNLIDMQINGPKVGSDYDAKVVTIKEYGAFVDIAQGVSGLVHISELADDRVNNVNDSVSEGDMIKVRVVEVDRMGRLKLSAKAAGKLEKKA